MKLNAAVQESLLALLCFDAGPHGAKAVRALVPVKWYDPYFRELATEAAAYLDQYGKPCGEHLLDIVEGLKERYDEHASIYARLYRSILTSKDGLNAPYVLKQAALFATRQRLRATVKKAAELLQRDREEDIRQAEAVMLAAKDPSPASSFGGGTWLHKPEALSFLNNEDDYLPLGIRELDAVNAGPVRKGLWLLLGAGNTGKSWVLIDRVGKQALLQKKNVVHFSLEMNEGQVTKRYFQSLFSITKRQSTVLYQKLRRDELGRFTEFAEKELRGRPSLDMDAAEDMLRAFQKRLEARARIHIKQFPTNGATVDDLLHYLDMLEATERFIPDVVIVDYGDLFKYDVKHARESIGKIYQSLRGIGVDRNMFIASVSQANREGGSAKSVRSKHLAEDWSKFGTVDTMITYSQTDAELELGLARLRLEKNRDDRKGVEVLISQAYAAGQFCMSSALMVPESYWRLLKGQDAEAEPHD